MNAHNDSFFCIYCDFLSECQAALTIHTLIQIASPERIKKSTKILYQIAMKVFKRLNTWIGLISMEQKIAMTNLRRNLKYMKLHNKEILLETDVYICISFGKI